MTPIDEELLLDEDSSDDEELVMAADELTIADELRTAVEELAIKDDLLLLDSSDELSSDELTEENKGALELSTELGLELAIIELAAVLLWSGVPPPPPHAVRARAIAAIHRFLCSVAIELIIV